VVADIAGALPIAGADLILARFLLTHLAWPDRALAAWAAAAAPAARLALHRDRSADLGSPRDHPLLRAGRRAAGPSLPGALHRRAVEGALAATPWRVIDSRALELRQPAAAMAELHVVNLRVWRNDPFARDNFDAGELDALDAALSALATGRDAAPPVRNVVRQIIAALD
jgi:hypothetical protein